MISTVIINTSGTMFDFGAGTYRRGTEIIGVSSEQSGAWVNAVTGAIGLNLRMVGACVTEHRQLDANQLRGGHHVPFGRPTAISSAGRRERSSTFPQRLCRRSLTAPWDCYSITFDSALNLSATCSSPET